MEKITTEKHEAVGDTEGIPDRKTIELMSEMRDEMLTNIKEAKKEKKENQKEMGKIVTGGEKKGEKQKKKKNGKIEAGKEGRNIKEAEKTAKGSHENKNKTTHAIDVKNVQNILEMSTETDSANKNKNLDTHEAGVVENQERPPLRVRMWSKLKHEVYFILFLLFLEWCVSFPFCFFGFRISLSIFYFSSSLFLSSHENQFVHYWTGTKLLAMNIRLAGNIVWNILQGKSMTRRERRLLVRTTADIFRMVCEKVQRRAEMCGRRSG